MFPCDSNFSGAGPAGKVNFYLFFIFNKIIFFDKQARKTIEIINKQTKTFSLVISC